MKIIRTASFNELLEKKKKTKPLKQPRNNRLQWDAEGDFSQRLNEEFSGDAKKKEDDAMGDKWDQLFNKSKKREPAFASKKDKKKKEPEMVKPFKR